MDTSPLSPKAIEQERNRLLGLFSQMSGEKTAEEVTAWLKEQAEASVGRWKDGIGPPDFPAFVEMILGSPLRPRQEDMFRRAKIITPDDFLDPERETIEIIVMWGKGCLSADTQLKDYASGQTKTMKEWAGIGCPISVMSIDGVRMASPVYMKGKERLFKVDLDDGSSFTGTSFHRVMSEDGWTEIRDLVPGKSRVQVQQRSAIHQTFYSASCKTDKAASDRFFGWDGSEKRRGFSSLEDTLPQCDRFREQTFPFQQHRSFQSTPVSCAPLGLERAVGFQGDCRLSRHFDDEQPLHRRDSARESAPLPVDALAHNLGPSDVLRALSVVVSVEAMGEGEYYDLTVPKTHCYFDASGILHHNSGKDMTMALLGAWVAAIICSLAGDPATYFGMAPGSTMYWVNVATNEDQATRVYFRDNLLRFIQHPYFAQFKPSIKSNEVWFPKSRLQLLSRHSHVAGLEGNNVIGFVMDEPDGMLDNQKRSLAGEIHEVFRSSAATRTTARPPLGVIIGYPWSDMGWLMRMKERVETALRAGDKQFFFDLASVFEVRPEVKRDHPIIAEEYRFNPRGARCKYECIAGSALDAWIDFPEKIYAANDPSLPFACEWDEVVTTNASGDEMIGALLSSIERKPGCEYFLGGDGAVSADSFTLAVWHVETSVQSAGWICRDCGGDGLESDWEYQKSVRMGAQYRRMSMTETVEYGPSVHCGICGVSPLRYGPVGMYAQVPGWWRNEIREQTADVKVGIESFSIPLIVEDALIEFKPKQAILHGEKNKPVDYVTECGVAEVTLLLMRELSIREAAFDPSHAVGIVQSLRRQGLNANTILFTTRPQYDRARLAKVLLYAGALKMLSPEAAPNDRMKETLITRNMEWKQIQQEKRKIQHPDGGRKDCWDAETVAIHLAASYIAPQLVNYHWEKDLDDQAMDRSRLIRAA